MLLINSGSRSTGWRLSVRHRKKSARSKLRRSGKQRPTVLIRKIQILFAHTKCSQNCVGLKSSRFTNKKVLSKENFHWPIAFQLLTSLRSSVAIDRGISRIRVLQDGVACMFTVMMAVRNSSKVKIVYASCTRSFYMTPHIRRKGKVSGLHSLFVP